MTHNDRATVRLPVNLLVAQVQDDGESTVQEAKDAHTDKELSRGGEISLQVSHVLAVIAVCNLIRLTRKPNKQKSYV